MAKFQHITNLRVPFDVADLGLLSALDDYRIGSPVQAKPKDGQPTLPITELQRMGVVGLYTTREALMSDVVRAKTGWLKPERELGVSWRPAE